MKGIAHFAAGIAAASCMPAAVARGAEGDPLYFILAGAAGLLPDTMDFKLLRYLYRADVEIIPDPLGPDMEQAAFAVAESVRLARVSGKPVKVKLHAVRLGADEWQSYRVAFDVSSCSVRAELGPVVDTGGNPTRVRTGKEFTARHECRLVLDYFSEIAVDILDGPVLAFEPIDGGRIRVVFLPWHRSWTHSFTVAVIAGLFAGLLIDVPAGIVVFVAWSSHIILDQAGYMGSNLLAPFTKKRVAGWKKCRSGDSRANLSVVWISCLLIFWNLYSGSGLMIEGLNPLKLFFWCVVVPWIFIRAFDREIR